MLVHGTAGRVSKIFVILLLLLVATAISAQTFHFHSPTESTSATRCTLCEVAPGILPVLTVSILSTPRPVRAVEVDEPQTSFQFLEGSNLSVRPPPPAFS
jgi:hypothetical protein